MWCCFAILCSFWFVKASTCHYKRFRDRVFVSFRTLVTLYFSHSSPLVEMVKYISLVLTALCTCNDLVACRDPNSGSSQDSATQLDDCLRSAVPTQIYVTCCIRENNCSSTRYQMRALDCISRITVTNSTLLMMSSQNNGYSSSSSSSSSERFPEGEILRRAAEICGQQHNSRQQQNLNCIRNELSRYCQNNMSTYRPAGYGYRMYSRRGSIPASAWDTSMYSDSYPVEWRRRGINYPDIPYYPRTFMSRRLYGREGGGNTRGNGGSYSYGGDSTSYYDEDYGSQSDESYSK